MSESSSIIKELKDKISTLQSSNKPFSSYQIKEEVDHSQKSVKKT